MDEPHTTLFCYECPEHGGGGLRIICPTCFMEALKILDEVRQQLNVGWRERSMLDRAFFLLLPSWIGRDRPLH